jgi:hypothetical protein
MSAALISAHEPQNATIWITKLAHQHDETPAHSGGYARSCRYED